MVSHSPLLLMESEEPAGQKGLMVVVSSATERAPRRLSSIGRDGHPKGLGRVVGIEGTTAHRMEVEGKKE